MWCVAAWRATPAVHSRLRLRLQTDRQTPDYQFLWVPSGCRGKGARVRIKATEAGRTRMNEEEVARLVHAAQHSTDSWADWGSTAPPSTRRSDPYHHPRPHPRFDPSPQAMSAFSPAPPHKRSLARTTAQAHKRTRAGRRLGREGARRRLGVAVFKYGQVRPRTGHRCWVTRTSVVVAGPRLPAPRQPPIIAPDLAARALGPATGRG